MLLRGNIVSGTQFCISFSCMHMPCFFFVNKNKITKNHFLSLLLLHILLKTIPPPPHFFFCCEKKKKQNLASKTMFARKIGAGYQKSHSPPRYTQFSQDPTNRMGCYRYSTLAKKSAMCVLQSTQKFDLLYENKTQQTKIKRQHEKRQRLINGGDL